MDEDIDVFRNSKVVNEADSTEQTVGISVLHDDKDDVSLEINMKIAPFFILLLLATTLQLNAQCLVDAGPDQTVCPGGGAQLTATSTQLMFGYQWSPATGLNQTYVLNPVAHPMVTTTYYVQATTLLDSNLIINGDFESGNTGFTSSYTYNPVTIWAEATYAVVTNPTSVHPNFASCTDHTSGTGNMMVVNGAGTPNISVWCQTVSVQPNTDYAFSTWLTSVVTSSPAVLQFSINGNVLGTPFTAPNQNCAWLQFYELWNSGANTTATICIVNQNTATSGNDFALDDISFKPFCVATDSVTVFVAPVPADAGPDTAVCSGDTAYLHAAGGSQYHWSSGHYGAAVSLVPPGDTVYYVTVTDATGCEGVDSVKVSLLPLPSVEAGQDQIICEKDTAVLIAAGASAYSWSSGSQNPMALVSPPLTSNYYVTGTDANGCSNYDSLWVFVRPLPQVVLTPDTGICLGDTAFLHAGGGASYLWNTGLSSPVYQALPQHDSTFYVTVTSQNGCEQNDSVTVTVFPLPEIGANATDTFLCLGTEVTLYATGGTTYQWYPFEGLSDSLGSPVTASPGMSIQYRVIGRDDKGCSDSAHITLTVQDCELTIPNVFTPDGDGINDEFEVKYEGLQGYELRIFNRWGRMVFESLDPHTFWDGKVKNADAAEGVYYYVLRVGSSVYKGTVSLVR